MLLFLISVSIYQLLLNADVYPSHKGIPLSVLRKLPKKVYVGDRENVSNDETGE